MFALFPLNGSRGLAGDVVHDSVDMSDLVDNAVGGGFKNVNRIVYDVTTKPPATIEWE